MTRRLPPLPPCLSIWHNDTPCQLEAGHQGDHINSHEHDNAFHTISWTDNIDELAHTWRRK